MPNDAEYWDEQSYKKITPRGTVDNYQKKRRIVRFLLKHDLAGKKCIEIGSGLATVAASIMLPNQLKVKYIGIDVSYGFAHGTHKLFGLQTICAESRSLPVTDNSFDFCLCLDSLEHIPSDHKRETWSEISRVLREDALVFINNPLSKSYHAKFVEHGFGMHDIADLCECGSFNVISLETYAVKDQKNGTYQFIELARGKCVDQDYSILS